MEPCPQKVCSLVWEVGAKQRRTDRVIAGRERTMLRKIIQIKGKESDGVVLLDRMFKGMLCGTGGIAPFYRERN